jgi:DNA-binding transcriptional LysR family regulator
MDRLDAMEMFVAAVDEGSLAAGARRLGRSPAAVTRAIALLERGLGERLLHRTTRQLRLTERGHRQLATYRQVLAELGQAETEKGEQHAVSGSLVLTAPELFGRLKVMPAVESFLERHRGISARILLLNRIVDLVREGVDVAVRLAPLPDSGLAAVKLGEVRRLACASPAYLAQAGRPKVPADLAGHECIGLNESGDRELWPFMQRDGARVRARSIQVRTRIALNSAAAALDAAVRGKGHSPIRWPATSLMAGLCACWWNTSRCPPPCIWSSTRSHGRAVPSAHLWIMPRRSCGMNWQGYRSWSRALRK